MKTSIIFSGPCASGKTYISNLISQLFPKESVRIDCCANTRVGIIRKIQSFDGKLKLIIFDECVDLKQIKKLHKAVKKRIPNPPNIIFCSQSDVPYKVKEFAIVKLPYSN